MGFLDNLSEKISSGSQKAAEKAKEVSEIAKLSATVEKEKVVQEKLYNEIGKKMYAEYRDLLLEKLPEETAKVDDSVKKMEDCKAALQSKKNVNVCPGCGKEVDKNAKFCPACGAVIPEAAEEAAEAEETAAEEASEETKTEE